MKNIFTYLLIAFLVFSCSTGDDNPSTDVVPLSPTELTGVLTESTQATLNWTDNSINETGFKIERKTGNDSYAQVGTVESNVTSYADNGLAAGTTYTYRVLAYNSVGNSLTNSNQVVITTPVEQTIPTVSTYDISSITTSSALSGGNITADGGSAVTSYGVIWSTSNNPTIALSTKTNNGSGIGSFTSAITGLTANTTYYVRAYATNNIGTAYGNALSFSTTAPVFANCGNVTDFDGNVYPSVTIGNQCWMQKNLNVEHYRNGDLIPQVTDATEWSNLTTGAWCYYKNITANGPVYGKLYNWYAVNDPRGLAPQGWHVAGNSEWTAMSTYLGGQSIAGGKMKASETWSSPNTGATNSSGFTALAGGARNNQGLFRTPGTWGVWWTADNDSEGISWYRILYNDSTNSDVFHINNTFGLSVRCVKD